MNIAFDLIFVLAGVAIIINHTVRGFVRSVLGALKLVIALVVSYLLTPLLFTGGYDMRMLGYVIVFISAYIVMTLLILLLDKIFSCGFLKPINRFLGFALGLVSAYIVLSVAAAGITGLLEAFGEKLIGQTQESLYANTYVYRFFCDYGLFTLPFINNLKR